MRWVLLTFIILLGTRILFAAPPSTPLTGDLAIPIVIEASEKPLDVEREGHSAPEVGDFDGDGVRDLLVGQYEEGLLRIYRNLGTNHNPRFEDFSWFMADGKRGRVQEGCCIGFCPQLIDLDGDALTDVISGSFPGEITFFRRQPNGTFEARRPLRTWSGQPVNVGSRASAFVVDWDGSGTPDLVIGTIVGDVYFLSGKLKEGEFVFGEDRKIEAGGEPLHIQGGEASPIAADWDGDGKLDLVVGTGHGSVFWYRNIGTPQKPELQAAQMLVGESPVGWGGDERRAKNDWGLRVKPCVVDWNGDGRMDLLLGDRCGGYLAKPSQTEAEKQEERQAHDRLPELRKAWSASFAEFRQLQTASATDDKLAAARHQLSRLKDEIARLQEIQEHYQPGYQAHGFVWLFLRRSDMTENSRTGNAGNR